jgi:hypothetical protein
LVSWHLSGTKFFGQRRQLCAARKAAYPLSPSPYRCPMKLRAKSESLRG